MTGVFPISPGHIKKNIWYMGRILRNVLSPKSIAYLILFVTDQCNARCRMCFSHDGMADKRVRASYDLLSLPDIEKILSEKRLKHLVQFTLSGGEPFLRDDLEEIINLYGRLHPYSRITIPTNGLMSERIENIMQRIVPKNRTLEISMPLTILGLGQDHDDMSGVAGHFKKLSRTMQALQPLRRYPNFKLSGITVISRHNQHHMAEIMAFFQQSAGNFDTFNILVARGDARDPATTEIDPSLYRGSRRKLPNRKVHINLLVHTLWRLIDYEMEYGKMDIACNAGKKLIIVSERGDVSPCELLYAFTDPYFGNLHDYNFDLGVLLESEKTRKIVNFIENKSCHCSFECAILSSMIFTPSNYGAFLKTLERNR